MADRPDLVPQWATTISTDATSGQLTNKEPTTAQKATGFVYNQTFPGNLANWALYTNYLWQQYYEQHLDQFAVAEQSTPDMTVRVTAGVMQSGATLTAVATQNTGTITAPTTNPRIDVVSLDSSNVVQVTTGAEAASPSIPAVSAGYTVLAYITLATTTTSITNDLITPYRSSPWHGVNRYGDTLTGTLTITGSMISGTLTATSGSITDSSGAISFGDENLSTTGTFSSGAATLATGSTVGTLTLADGSITDSSGAISFGNENLTTTGNVGIGTSAIARLTVGGSTGELIRLSDSSSTGNPYLSFYQTTTARAYIQYLDSGDNLSLESTVGGILFKSASAEALRIDSSKNLLLGGTATPTSASGVLVLSNKTLGSALANTIQITSEDLTAGNTIPSIRTEGGGIFSAGTPAAAAGSIAIKIDGTVYHFTVSTTAAS